MSARVILLFRIYKDCLGQTLHRFWKIQLPSLELLTCMAELLTYGMYGEGCWVYTSLSYLLKVRIHVSSMPFMLHRERNKLGFLHMWTTMKGTCWQPLAMEKSLHWKIGMVQLSDAYWESLLSEGWGETLSILWPESMCQQLLWS